MHNNGDMRWPRPAVSDSQNNAYCDGSMHHVLFTTKRRQSLPRDPDDEINYSMVRIRAVRMCDGAVQGIWFELRNIFRTAL